MPASRLYNFSLKQPTFEVMPFQAVTFEPAEKANVGLLSDSFDKITERNRLLATQEAALTKAFSEIGDKLYLGKNKDYTGGEQAVWFKNFQKKYRDKIQAHVNAGDVTTAINEATKLAADAVNDPELKARMDASSKYEKYNETAETNAKQKGAQDLYNWWHGKYGHFSFFPEYDEDGNFVTADDWEPAQPFYEPFQPAVDAKVAFEFFNPDTRSTSSGSSSSTSFSKDGTGSSSSHGSSSSRDITQVTVNDLKRLMPVLKASSPDGMNAVDQRYEWECDRYRELQQQIEANKEYDPEWENSPAGKRAAMKLKEFGKFILNENGVIDDSTGYWARTVYNEVLLQSLAYTKLSTSHNTQNSSSRTINTDPDGSKSAVAQQRAIDNYRGNTPSQQYVVEGELVGKSYGYGQGLGVVKTQYQQGNVDQVNNLFYTP